MKGIVLNSPTCDEKYHPEDEAEILYSDADVDIEWPYSGELF